MAANVAESHPDTRVHGGMILRIVWLWRVIASDLNRVGRVDMSKERAGDFVVGKNVRGKGLLANVDYDMVGVNVKADRWLLRGQRAACYQKDMDRNGPDPRFRL